MWKILERAASFFIGFLGFLLLILIMAFLMAHYPKLFVAILIVALIYIFIDKD